APESGAFFAERALHAQAMRCILPMGQVPRMESPARVMLRTRALALICVPAAMAALAIAGPQGEDKQKPPTVIRAATQLVQVNLIAVDPKGNPVSDLTTRDLILTDNNEPQRISVFYVQKNEPATGRSGRLPA